MGVKGHEVRKKLGDIDKTQKEKRKSWKWFTKMKKNRYTGIVRG